MEQAEKKLPEGLEEAAKKYTNDSLMNLGAILRVNVINAFKAGAEWMAGQGEIRELLVARGATENYIGGFVVDENKFHSGEEVIVQIRKKEDEK